MPTKKTWAEIKASKTPDEWKKRNKAYAKRFAMKAELKRRGVNLMNKIQNAVPIGQKGMRDSLIREVNEALRLRHCWMQPDYDRAVLMLDAVEEKFNKLATHVIPPNNPLANAFLMFIDVAQGTEKEKAVALEQVIEHNAQMLAVENVEKMENNLINFLITMVRKPDGHYPKWFVERLCNTATNMLLDDDLQALQNKLANYISGKDFLTNSFGKVLGFEKMGKDEDEI